MLDMGNIRLNIYVYRFMLVTCIYFGDLDEYEYWESMLEKEIIKLTKAIEESVKKNG
ncbi:hypothetical protein [Vibrio jasicida]|uniref:hypothetical protein n=1 Tax=Vibrio jasicida TaxID=766224 RepID=UPI0040679E44